MRKVYAKWGLFLMMGFASMVSQAQFKCGTDEAFAKAAQADPSILKRHKELDRYIAQYIANKGLDTIDSNLVVTIPIVFHVIHLRGSENIPDKAMLDAVKVLNEDFSATNPDRGDIVAEWKGRNANIKVKFALATIDPDGNCTTGIDRIQSHETYLAAEGAYRARINGWPHHHYLNVWVSQNIDDGAAGIATFPASAPGPYQPKDGISMLFNYVGPGTHVLTHEVGHWFNLYHIWGNTEVGSSCGDDDVPDTPVTRGHSGCQGILSRNAECDKDPLQMYGFNEVTTTSGTVDPTTRRTNRGLIETPWKAVNLSANSTANDAFAFTGWPDGGHQGDTSTAQFTGSIDLTKYYEVSYAPIFGSKVNVSEFNFKVRRSDNGPRTFAIRSSHNNFTSNLKVTTPGSQTGLDTIFGQNIFYFVKDSAQSNFGARILLDSSQFVQRDNPITFRVYGWNAEDASGSFGFDSIGTDANSALVENLQNYMDYTYCHRMFTEGQSIRMRAALSDSIALRNHLWTAENLAATGTDGINTKNCAPLPDFYPSRMIACQNTNVTFHDNSSRAFVTSRNWEFEGGNPATSNGQDVSVKWSTPGWKKVTLTVTGDHGTETKVVEKSVFISHKDVSLEAPYVTDFSATEIGANWMSENFENNATSFQQVANVGFHDKKSIKLNAAQSIGGRTITDGEGDEDILYTPSFNLLGKTGWWMIFNMSSATKTSVPSKMTEQLNLEYSPNCGSSWIAMRTFTKQQLANAGNKTASFTPASKEEWQQVAIQLSGSQAADNVRFRFRYTSGANSNNLYIDDFSIQPASSIAEAEAHNMNVSIYPNPVTQNTVASIALFQNADLNVNITDITGKVVATRNAGQLEAGEHNIELAPMTSELRAGVYFISIKAGQNVITKKLIVE